jgi:phytoene dehydrogenase-like protein
LETGVTTTDVYDGIMVGAGHNSLVCAAYLARAGQRILIVEAAPRIGGGTTTEETTLQGYRHNLHAFFVRWTPDYTIWDDLELDRHGVRSIWPDVQNAVPFDGGERALVTYRSLARSLESIADVSPEDAETYARLHEEYRTLIEAIEAPLRFAPPLPPDEQDDLLARSAIGRRYLSVQNQSPLELVSGAFSHEALRALVLFNVAVRGYLPNLDVPGLGAIVPLALVNSHDGRLIAGGTGRVADALAASAAGHGADVMTGTAVSAVDVEHGRAVGVTLEDGRRFGARHFVASSVPAPLTMLDLVGPSHLDRGLRHELEGYRWLEEALFGLHWALDDRPRFKAEEHNPDVPAALNLALGYESSTALIEHMEALRAESDVTSGPSHVSIPTIHDPGQAPPGGHTSFAWHFVPGQSRRGSWDDAAVTGRTRAMVDTYLRYAPNLEDATVAVAVHSPDDTEEWDAAMRGGDRHHGSYHPSNWGYNRPSALMPGYRTPVEHLYLCGASQHPGGSFTGQPGYNAAGVIASDLDIEPWWGPPQVRDLLVDLV